MYYQSRHLADYEECLVELAQRNFTYRCECSRKTLAELHAAQRLTNENSGIYPGLCRNKHIADEIPCAIRVKTESRRISFQDGLQGEVSADLAEVYGDFILKRKDGIIAYQLAVVVDDRNQKVNKIVRGCDLLTETPKQIYLQQLLGLPTPHYAHVPVIVDANGQKLSKQTLAEAVSTQAANKVLFDLLVLLRQQPPQELAGAAVYDLLAWAVKNWQADLLTCVNSLRIS